MQRFIRATPMVTVEWFHLSLIGFHAHHIDFIHHKSSLPSDCWETDNPLNSWGWQELKRVAPPWIIQWAIKVWKSFGLCGWDHHAALPPKNQKSRLPIERTIVQSDETSCSKINYITKVALQSGCYCKLTHWQRNNAFDLILNGEERFQHLLLLFLC